MLLTQEQYEEKLSHTTEALERATAEGLISLEEIVWWLELSRAKRLKIMAGNYPESKIVYESPEDFVLLWKFELVVPDDYHHETSLTDFWRKYGKEFFHKSPGAKGDRPRISDAKFNGPSRILSPGEKFEVRLYKNLRRLSSEECLALYEKERAYCTGAQGLALLYDQNRYKLPGNSGVVSMDKIERLPVDKGHHLVPILRFIPPERIIFFGGTSSEWFDFSVGIFEGVWWEDWEVEKLHISRGYVFALFCDPT